MQNQEIVETKRLTKQEYNKLYYQRNKERWMSKKREGVVGNVLQLFSNAAIQKNSKRSELPMRLNVLKYVELGILITIVGLVTLFLIREAASFYLDAHEGNNIAYFKAGLIEIAAILFSLSRSRHSFLRWAQRCAVILLSAFTLFIMSGKAVKTAVEGNAKVHFAEQTLKQLESELSQKEGLRAHYLDRGWLKSTKRYEVGVDQLRQKIISMRHDLGEMQDPQVAMSNLSILILFRLILVVINLICFHRIVEKFESEFVQIESNQPGFEPNLP